jgi:DNA-binding NarL/FixJ family response regulator
MSTFPIRLALIDDHSIIRESWKMLLENNPQFLVIADEPNELKVLDQIIELKPDVVLIDISMSSNKWLLLTQGLLVAMPDIKIIGLSANNQTKYATRMLGLGARGYLTKTSSLEEINKGILEVAAGKTYICDEIRIHLPSL